MKIWLVRQGDNIPLEKNVRLMRTASLADYLSQKGHSVIWWTSSFSHYEKRYICKEYTEFKINPNETIICLHSPISYKRNISLQRIVYHKILGKQLKLHMPNKDKPDIILCCWPLIEFAEAVIEYGKKNNVPVILDARDQWPDTFLRAFPKKFQGIANIFLKPMRVKTRYLFSNADGITAVTDSALEWAHNYTEGKSNEDDRVIYIGNKRNELTQYQFNESIEWFKKIGVSSTDWIICFFSTFGAHIAIDVVIKAVKELSIEYKNIKLVLGGGGDREKEFRNLADNCDNIVFAGWLDNNKMTSLMKISKCGAFSIKNTFDFKDTFNNKAIQYISEGLPILNSLSGFPKTFICEKNMGLSYECDNVADCKNKIMELYKNDEERVIKGENGLKCFYDLFDSEVVNRQFEEYLLLKKNSRF